MTKPLLDFTLPRPRWRGILTMVSKLVPALAEGDPDAERHGLELLEHGSKAARAQLTIDGRCIADIRISD